MPTFSGGSKTQKTLKWRIFCLRKHIVRKNSCTFVGDSDMLKSLRAQINALFGDFRSKKVS